MHEQSAGAPQKSFVFTAFAVTLIALLVCYWPWLLGLKDFVLVDCQYTYQPVCSFVQQSISKGEAPFWNPHNYCGFSELAVPSPSLFYPLNYLMFLFPFSIGEAAYMAFHQLASAVAAYLYTLSLSKDWRAACYAGVAVALCGYFFSVHKYPDFAANVCLFLFSMWAGYGVCKYRTPLYVVAFPLLVCLFILAGRPEIISVGFVLILAQLFILSLDKPKGQRISSLLLCAGLLALGVLMSAPVVLPGLEWLKLSPRSAGLRGDEIFQWSASLYDLVSVFFWYPFGDLEMPRTDTASVLTLLKSNAGIQLPFLSPAYMGPGFFVCLLAGLVSPSTGRLRLVLLIAAGSALVATLGSNTPVAPFLLGLFPKLAIVRYPVKLIIFFLLPTILLSAYGFVAVQEGRCRKTLIACLAGFVLVLLLALGTNLFGGPAKLIQDACTAQNAHLLASEIASLAKDVSFSCIFTALFGIAFCLLCLSKILFSKMSLRYGLILATAVLPMFCFGLSAQGRSAPGRYYDSKPALASVLENIDKTDSKNLRPRICHLLSEPLKIPTQYIDLQVNEQLKREIVVTKFGRDVLLPDAHFDSGWDLSNGYALAESALLNSLFRSAHGSSSIQNGAGKEAADYPLARFCSLTNSNYVITAIDDFSGKALPVLDPTLFELASEVKDLNVRIFSLKQPASRFYFASTVRAVENWAVLGQLVVAAKKDDILLGDKDTFLNTIDFAQLRQELKKTDQSITKSGFECVFYKSSAIAFRAKRKQAGVLILRDFPYPGWEASIDGKAVKLFQANLINRGIIVPAGEHYVLFEFKPRSLQYGLLCFGIAFGTLVVLAVCLLKNRKLRNEE